jgi:hypothetical protein
MLRNQQEEVRGMRAKFLTTAVTIALLGLAAPAMAKTVVATTANAGSTVHVRTGDTLVVKLPGHWKLAGAATPELALGTSMFKGHGARGRTTITLSAKTPGAVKLGVKNAVTGIALSMRVDVTPGH